MADSPDQTQGNEPEARPSWLPENFKSPEDLVTSYKEAQRKISEMGEQNAALTAAHGDLESRFEEMEAQFSSAQQQSQGNQNLDALYDMYERDPVSTMALIAQQAAQATMAQSQPQQQQFAQQQEGGLADVVAQIAMQNMGARYSDWADVAPQVGEFLTANPQYLSENTDLTVQSVESALDNAYKIVSWNRESSLTDEQRAERDESMRQQKLAAQTLAGAGTRPNAPDDGVAEWERIKAATPKPYYDGLPYS